MGGKARSQSLFTGSTGSAAPRAGRSGSAAPRGRAAAPEHVEKILEVLQETWAKAHCELRHEDPYQLLCATILSAQTTDRRVNRVTRELFERYPDPAALARADLGELETIIHSTGFHRAKARNLRATAELLVERHGGEVPRTMRQLLTLPGVARKTANLVLGVAFGVASGIVVDTHVHRVSVRLGLAGDRENFPGSDPARGAAGSSPVAIERELMAIIPRRRWIAVSQQLIWHGRRVCHARKAPECVECTLAPSCPSASLLASHGRGSR